MVKLCENMSKYMSRILNVWPSRKTESFQPIAETDRNPAHRRPWLKMKIEYHPALIFCAFVRGFLKFQVYTLFVAEFHWKVSYMAFSPQRNDNFNAFLK